MPKKTSQIYPPLYVHTCLVQGHTSSCLDEDKYLLIGLLAPRAIFSKIRLLLPSSNSFGDFALRVKILAYQGLSILSLCFSRLTFHYSLFSSATQTH